jgi:hypothetical protein
VRIGESFAGITRTAGLVVACSSMLASGAVPIQPSSQATVRWRDVSMEDYRKHLLALTSLVDACAKGRDIPSCDPTLVGPDDRVPLADSSNAERRLIRYGWLRVLFSKAEDSDQPTTAPAANQRHDANKKATFLPRPPTSLLLLTAEKRLKSDLAQASAPVDFPPAHINERETMKLVLAGPDFRNLEQPTVRDSLLEKLGNWLNHIFESAANLKARSAWVGRVLVWGFILAVCVGLVWGLLQIERRWRLRLLPEDERPPSGAASARDWQLWLDDARRAATAGQWREAIHFVYWASISRLESKRLWPADRARTPREYLALVAPEDPRKAGLAELTGNFERTWYGGRSAGEREYLKAENLADALISGGAAPGASNIAAVPESGGR